MKIVGCVAGGRGDLIEGRQWSPKIERIVAAANEESNSMHDEAID
ncbi:UNVERIFIED_ORG: hypothetical protein ABIC48_000854 [Burkholderia territorii]